MDYAAQDRKPGQVTITIGELQQAAASLEDRIHILRERMSPVRYSNPRPADPQAKAVDAPMAMAPMAEEINSVTIRLQRMEAQLVELQEEVQI